MKVTHSEKKITAFGGLNFCHDLFINSGVKGLIDSHLGIRAKLMGFDYSDILSTHMSVFLAGGDSTEDANEHLRDSLKLIPSLSVCSADTILRGINELTTPLITHQSANGIGHEFNINSRLNELLIKSLKKTNQLDTKTKYTLDYDNQVIATQKYDAKMSYKKCLGYQSGISSIGDLIIAVEGRNGNSPASYKQEETLARTFTLLERQTIQTNRFRADAASYQKEVLDLVIKKNMLFYIRAKNCASMEVQIGQIPKEHWVKIRLGVQEMEVAEIDYIPFGQTQSYRLVVSRIKRKDQQANLFSGTTYKYRSIITNDRFMILKEVVSFYNKRGSSERIFDTMNNDFGWGNLPFSFLNQNTAFMIITALYANFYRYMITYFSKKCAWLKENYRLKKFVFRFVTVAANWIRRGRQNILKLYTNKDYSPLTL